MCGSGRQLGAALTATRGQDGATRAGPHAGTEAVRAAAAPETRLERALAHGTLPVLCVVARPKAHGNGRYVSDPSTLRGTPDREQTVSRAGRVKNPGGPSCGPCDQQLDAPLDGLVRGH